MPALPPARKHTHLQRLLCDFIQADASGLLANVTKSSSAGHHIDKKVSHTRLQNGSAVLTDAIQSADFILCEIHSFSSVVAALVLHVLLGAQHGNYSAAGPEHGHVPDQDVTKCRCGTLLLMYMHWRPSDTPELKGLGIAAIGEDDASKRAKMYVLGLKRPSA
jgi:hypothetical protein